MSILFYRRPDYMAKSYGPINKTECAVYVERAKRSERAIPKGLSFEEIIENKALPPCSLPDFMDYLMYIERNAENLQFYLWYKDYVRRWETEVSKNDKALSMKWDYGATEVPDLNKDPNTETQRSGSRIGRFRRPAKESQNDLREAPRSIDINGRNWDFGLPGKVKPITHEIGTESVISFPSGQSASQSNATGQTWQPFSIQPCRDEVNQIILHYIGFDSPRELNISHKDRIATLHALQNTTHPSAFLLAFNIAEIALRGQSHPNFIRWSICNGNKPRVFFVRTMGVSHTIFGFMIAIPLVLSGVSRWWRILAAPMWFIGLSTLIAAYKGLCVILHTTHQRNLRPWEDAASSSSSVTDVEIGNSKTHLAPGSVQITEKLSDGTIRHLMNLGSNANRDSGESQKRQWSKLYNEKSLIRKVFDKTTWTQDETLRLLQDKIVLGANIWALFITVILTVVFTALPKGNFY